MASARQEMLGRIIDTALTNDPPFERRPRFIDDAAAADYMSRLRKHGKMAMDAELHDATYGDDAPTLKQRIALARLRTRAWKGDVKAQQALNALASKTTLMGWSIKPWKWGSHKQSANDIRLAKMRAAQKRLQSARAKAAAADAETEAEQRTQQAIADAADAEADAADAEATAKEQKMRTAEAEANPDSIPSADADTADAAQGWGFRSAFKKLGHGLKKGLTTYNPAYRIAKKGFDVTAKRFLPNRDAQKAKMVKSLYKRLWFEHANWLALQDLNAGLPLKPREQYELVAKLWAKAELAKQHLPTQFAVSDATVLGSAILPEIMGSWWNPLSWFGAQSQTVLVNTQDKRSATGPDGQPAEAPDGTMDPNALPYAPSTDPSANVPADGSPDVSTGLDYEIDPEGARQLATSAATTAKNLRAASLLGMMR